MATYQTKHLEATRELSHGDKFFKPGEAFEASEVDAEHYLRKGYAKAVEAPAPAKAAPKAAAPAPAPAPAKAAPPARAPAARPSAIASRAAFVREGGTAAPAPAAPAPAEAQSTWERTEPLKLADVPHKDVDATPAKE